VSPAGTDARTRPAAPGRPPVDPRIRQRRAAVARTRVRRRRWVVLALVAAAVVVAGGWALLHSRLLSARAVVVVGSVHTPVAEIESVAGLTTHPSLIDVDPGRVAAALERLPWVRTAEVSRRWPDGVRITVVEETPVAAVAVPPAKVGAPTTAWALIDRSGRVLADVAAPPAGVVPLVGTGAPGAPGTGLGAGAAPGLEVAATLPRAFSAQVTTVVVGRGGAVTLRLTTPVTVRLGTASDLAAKYEDAAAVLSGAPLQAGDVVNVSAPDSPTVGLG